MSHQKTALNPIIPNIRLSVKKATLTHNRIKVALLVYYFKFKK